jgi:sporulation-control protein spo0M
MELTAFNSRLGFSQGRIPLEETDQFVFVLGDDVPGYVYNLEPGDHAQVVQEIDLTDVSIVQTELSVKVQDSTPDRIGFELSIVVDNIKMATTVCLTGQERRITDLSANVSKSTGVHTVGVRLEIVEV